jgi:hypothetical protein
MIITIIKASSLKALNFKSTYDFWRGSLIGICLLLLFLLRYELPYLEHTAPPKVEYRLTARARELGVILKDLGRWAQRWKSPRIPATMLE